MSPGDDLYIWVNRWDEFQTFQNKKGKPWAPPWIKTYVAQLSDDRYLELTDRQRALLHDLRMVFAMTRGRLRRDSPTLARYRHRQTRDDDLVALNHAGFITFCSGTVLESFRNQFWNRSTLEVDVEKEVEEPSFLPTSTYNGRQEGRTENTERKRPKTEADIAAEQEVEIPF